MRLQKLELIGFKSFADKTVVEFDGNMTAFVGPNGSGKSNVVDALKWVLGEQSARRLRGAEMADMVFSGSTSRPALSCAEVRVTLLNDRGLLPVEYQEVCIARRCYRSGESEYLLNGQPCRLKDIRSLLFDTGVGVSAYSFMEQGQVDMLIRAGSRERRRVLEEAAGVSRFLAQKKEAENKLERVRTNLLRVTDIVQELERQLRSVRYQAAKARRFKRLGDELRRLRLALGVHARRRLLEKRGQNGGAIEGQEALSRELNDRLTGLRAELSKAQQDLEHHRSEMAKAEERLSQIEARHYGLGREIELNRNRCAELDERRRQEDARTAEAQESIRKVREEVAEADSQMARGAAALDERRAACEELAAALHVAEEGLRELEGRLDGEKAGVFELMQQESHLQNQIGMLSAQQATLAGRLRRQQDRRDHLSGQRDRLGAERTEVQGRLDAVRRELEQVRRDKAGVDNRLSESTLHMGRLTSEIGEMKAELKGRISRRQVIQDLQDTAEGVGSGVKLILAEIARAGSPLAGSPGLLADLLEVPRRDALALEAALGHRVQGIVVNTRLQAVEALRLLRRGRKGRAEVIVLEDLAVAPRLEMPRRDGEAARLADLVRVSGGAEPAVEALLGNCFVVDEAEAAQRLLAGELPSGMRIVTREGECFEPGGLWSAGEPETGSLISRRSELAELAEEIEELKSRLDALSGEGERCAASMAALERERAALASQREELGEQENDLRSRHALLASQEEQRAEELELIGSEIASLSEDIDGAKQRSVQAAGEAESVRGRRSEREAALEGLKAELGRERELQERLVGEVSAVRSELARREEQLSGLKALAERQRGELRRRQDELGELARQREAGEGLRREADEWIREAMAEQAVLEQERTGLAALAREKAGAVEQVRAAMEERQALAERATEERDGAERDLQQLRLVENELRLKLENLGERVADECGVRLAVLERDPDSWREEPPFTDVQIEEFTATEEQPQAMVARWYAEAESAPAEAEEGADEPGRRKVGLADAVELREGVLGMANDPETDWEATRARVEALKKQVGQMGGANLDAIREQDELEVRAQFLTNQKDDLDRARRQELEIIRELSVKSRQNFLETFEAVQANFQVIVRKLFGGGAGEIMLEGDVEDVLEAGIEIMVRPPGKETRSISLLSGGEKALSAVALLFAIFKAKPSPFCVLDEVDAPLDEANVGRFISLVQEYCENTQFVIVTHNKVTMGAAQTLYGISLREDGVSQKVAVNFEEVDSRLEEMRRQTRQAQGRAKAG